MDIQTGILQAVAYADMYDYPLTCAEIQRYYPTDHVDMAAVQQATAEMVPSRLRVQNGCYFLPGRASIVVTRQQRAQIAAAVWPRARRYGRIIAGMPFVRMVAVTGSLAVNNVEADGDIDYLIVTEPGRLWSCRAFVIALVRLARLRGDEICPNYLITTRQMAFTVQNLFTAHEFVQMVPLAGARYFRQMVALNRWTAHYLPNASIDTRIPSSGTSPVKRLAEHALGSPLGTRFERWEMQRKIAKFSRQAATSEAVFTADTCKGHFDQHGERALRRLENG